MLDESEMTASELNRRLRRLKAGVLPLAYSIRWMQGKDRVVNLPEDACIVGFFHDWQRDGLGVYIWSETYPEVPEYQMMEIVDLIVERMP